MSQRVLIPQKFLSSYKCDDKGNIFNRMKKFSKDISVSLPVLFKTNRKRSKILTDNFVAINKERVDSPYCVAYLISIVAETRDRALTFF